MRIGIDLIVALIYKLSMFDVPLDGPSGLVCYDQGVVNNTRLTQSTLSKKHNAVNYHVVSKAAVAGTLQVGK